MNELTTILSFPFFQRALVVGVLLAISCSVIGGIIVLRRLSFFSDAVAHTSLTGIAIALLLGVNELLGAIVMSIIVGLTLSSLIKRKSLASDTLIGVLFSASIALAIFIISVLPSAQIDLQSILFGNILTTTTLDIWLAVLLSIFTGIYFIFFTRPTLKLVYNEELAQIENTSTRIIENIFFALIAFAIAISLKMVGAILVSALIILPAASAQNVSSSIRELFITALCTGVLAVLIGLFLSFFFDAPSGASIVLTLTGFFLVSLFLRRQ